jgi:hypothetical protein
MEMTRPKTTVLRSRSLARFLELCERTTLWWLLAAALVVTGLHVIRSLDLSQDDFEGSMMVVSQRMSQGFPNPEWIAKLPYTVSPYGPAYPALARVVSSIDPRPGSLIPGRLLSLIAGLLTAALVGLVIRRATNSDALALASATMYLNYSGLSYWLHECRVDALAVLFAVAAYVTSGVSRRGLAISAVMVVAGSLVKQTVAFAAVPIVLHLIIVGRIRQAGLYTLGVLALAGVVWGALFYASGGYYLDLGLRNHRAFSPARAAVYAGWFFREPFTVITLLAALRAALVDPVSVVRCRYFVAAAVAAGLAAVLSGLEGSHRNYYLEAAALASVVLALYGINPLWKRSRKWTSVLLSVASVVVIVGQTGKAVHDVQSVKRAPDLTSALGAAQAPYILADSNRIASVTSAGLVPAVNDPFLYRILARNRMIDAGRLADDLRAGRVGGLVLSRPLEQYSIDGKTWPAEIVDAMKSHFAAVASDNSNTYIYLYNCAREIEIRSARRLTRR